MIESTSGDGISGIGENSLKSHFIIKKNVGKQIVGYTVDLSKSSPEAVVEWLKTNDTVTIEHGSVLDTPDANSKYAGTTIEKPAEEPNE